MAVNCSMIGIFNDIHLRNVTPSDTPHYGHFLGLGATYSQNNSLWTSITHNETSFRASGFCATGSLPECVTSLSGEIVPGSSWQDNASYVPRDDPSVYTGVSSRYGNDIFNIFTHYVDPSPPSITQLSDFPLNLVSNYTSEVDPFFGPGGNFGLGPGSTVLGRLFEKRLIGSRSYGLHIGTGFPRAGGVINGSIVLGGYDAMRFIGPIHKYSQVPVSAQNLFSPFQVKIAQVTLGLGPGQSLDLVDGDPFEAYLTTTQYPVQFPSSITQQLADKLSAKPATNDDNTLQLPNGSNASLTITLDDGFSVTFDSTWLANVSSISPISAAPLSASNVSSSNTTANLPNVLGAAFLQQLYMFVEYDSSPSTFSLAQVNPDPSYVQQQSLCPGIQPQAASFPNINNFLSKGLIGAVIGGVIGGIAFVCFILFMLRFSLRKWRPKKASDVERPRFDDCTKPKGHGQTLRKMVLSTKQTVTFSSAPQVKYVPPSPHLGMDDRCASFSSTSTKVSHVQITTNQEKDVGVNNYRNSTGLSQLDFGFGPGNSAPLSWQLLQPASIHTAHRSSSVYSGDR